MKWLLRQKGKKFPSCNNSNQTKLNKNKTHKYSNYSKLTNSDDKYSLKNISLIFLLIILIVPHSSFKKEESLQSHSGKIDLKILGTGEQYILGENYGNYYPSRVYLNGELLNDYYYERYIYIDPLYVSQTTNVIT